MSGIRQKQINDLVFDISSLYTGSDVFNRDTTYTLGTPLEGQAQLDSSNAALATTLHIHTKDSAIGNRFETLEDFQKHDTLIIQTSTGAIAKYEIKSIQSAVDLSNEGHFILTIQHSFGYSSTFQNEKMSYYFRRSASDVLIENLKAEIEFLRAETQSSMQVERIARAIEDTRYSKILSVTKIENNLDSNVSCILHSYNDSPTNTMRPVSWTINSVVVPAKITFIAPRSGNVRVVMRTYLQDSGTNSESFIGLHNSFQDTTNPSEGWYQIAKDAERHEHDLENIEFLLEGLTPGTSYTYYYVAITTHPTNEAALLAGRNSSNNWSNIDLAKPTTITAYDIGDANITTNPTV